MAIGRRRHVPVAGEEVRRAAHLGGEHLLTVDRDLDAVGELHAGDVAVEVAHEADGELVLGILREVVTEADATSSAEAQAVHFVLLRIVRGHAIGEPHDLGVGADGQAAHTPGGGQVLFEQRRRDAQHAGDVVEAVALVIGRQQVHDVDLQVEQIAHGVAVLGAVQAVDRLVSRVRRGQCLRVDPPLERGREPLQCGLVGSRHAHRRHHAAAQLHDHLFPDVRVAGGRRRVEPLERQPAGQGAGIVAGDAVPLDERLLGCCGAAGLVAAGAARCPPGAGACGWADG